MIKTQRLFALIGILILTGCASALAPNVSSETKALKSGQYALDPTHASILFKIDHLGFSNYIGRFELFDASLNFDEENPSLASVEATIDMASLDIANDSFAETLLGPDWFDAGRFPQAVFRSGAINVTGQNTGTIAGELTLKGVTAPISLDVTFNGGARDLIRSAYIVGFSATGTIDRTIFGIDRFAGVIGNDVKIEIEAEFSRN